MTSVFCAFCIFCVFPLFYSQITENIATDVPKLQTLYFLLRGCSAAGVCTTESRQIRLDQKIIQKLDGIAVYEIPTSQVPKFQDMLHSQHLGEHLTRLHNLDIDFTKDLQGVSAVVVSAQHSKFTWQVSTAHQMSRGYCNRNSFCAQTQENVLHLPHINSDGSNLYFVCVSGNETTLHQELTMSTLPEFEVCSNGIKIDNTPPHQGTVSVSSGLYTHESSQLLITWEGFYDADEIYGEHDGIRQYWYGIGKLF